MTGNTSTPGEKLRALFLAALMVLSVMAAGVAFTGTVSATANASVTASPDSPSSTSIHTVTGEVEPNDDSSSLNDLEVDYSVDGNFDGDISNVGTGDVVRVGIDSDNDGTIETDVSGDLNSVSSSNNGETLLFGFGGSFQLAQGEDVIVEYTNVQNPSATGTYNADVAINTQSTDNPTTSTYTITAPSVTATNTGDTVGDDVTVTGDTELGETVTIENIIDGEVKNTVTVTDGGSADEDGSEDGSVTVTLSAGKSADDTQTVNLTDSDDNTLSDTYATTNYLVVTSPENVTQGGTSTIQGDIYEHPGDLQKDETLDYSLVYEPNSTTSPESTNDIVLAESDTNSGEFSVERTFDQLDDEFGEEHLNDYPSDAFDNAAGGEPSYTVYVDSATDSDGPAATGPYSKETPSVDNNEGFDIVDVRLDVTASPDNSPIQYADSVDVSGDVLNADGGLGNYAVKLETPTGVTAKTTDTASNGAYTYTAVFNDAGEWAFGTDEGGFIQYETFTVEAADADVTLTNDSGNLANFPETYTVTVDDSNGNNIVLNASNNNEYEGYVALVGQFEAPGFSANSGGVQATVNPADVTGNFNGNFLRAADINDDGDADQIHLDTEANGELTVSDVVPTGSETTAQLQNDLGFNRSNQTSSNIDATLDDIVVGVENYRDAGNTPDSPDFVGEDTNNVRLADPVNVIDPAVNDPQSTQISNVGDAANFTDILTDSGPAVVEVLPLADVDNERLDNGNRLGFDGNKNLAGMTVYNVSFELRDQDNNEIEPGANTGDFHFLDINGAGINATVFETGFTATNGITGPSIGVDSRNDNVLDARYTDVDNDGDEEYSFLIRPVSVDTDDEQINHEINVRGEDAVQLPLETEGLDIEEFLVNGDSTTAVAGNQQVDITSVVEAPNDGNAPVNNGRVRLTQTGPFTLNAETDARTQNVNNGQYTFENTDIGPRGIDDSGDGIADRISELVFTAYQYTDSNNDQALDQREVDRAAVETLPLSVDESLQVSFDAENTSKYSGFNPNPFGGQTFTLTKGVEYEQLAFELTTSNGEPVDLTQGINGQTVDLDTLDDSTVNGENFVQIVGAVQDTDAAHSIEFNVSASNPSEGLYVIDDIQRSDYISSTSSAVTEGDSFAFDENSPRSVDTFQLQITTPNASRATDTSTTGFFNAEDPIVDTEIEYVSTDSRTTWTPVENVSTMTVGINRWYRVNATWNDATGTPMNGSDFNLIQLGMGDTLAGNASFDILPTLGNNIYPNDDLDAGPEDRGLVLNNESGSFQFDVKPTASNSNGVFVPEFRTYAMNNFGWASFPDAFFAGTPTGQNPVVEVYDEQGSDLPVNPSNASDNDVLANDVKNNLRVEAFQADPNDLDLETSQEFGFPNDQPFAENIVGTTTSTSSDVVTPEYDRGQIGFLAITPTGTGSSILDLISDNNGGPAPTVVDTNNTPIQFDVLRSNLRVNATLSSDDIDAGENVTVTLTARSTGDLIPRAGVSLVSPAGNVIAQNATNAGGQVTFEVPENATDGTYSVTTRPAGFEPVDEGQVELSVSGTEQDVTLPGAQGPAEDLNGDGLAEDTNGDGQFTLADITFLFNNQADSSVQNNEDLFDFNGNGGFSLSDVTFWFNNQNAFSP